MRFIDVVFAAYLGGLSAIVTINLLRAALGEWLAKKAGK